MEYFKSDVAIKIFICFKEVESNSNVSVCFAAATRGSEPEFVVGRQRTIHLIMDFSIVGTTAWNTTTQQGLKNN